MNNKIENFFDVYNKINDIVKAILKGIDKPGYLGEICEGKAGDYFFVMINYLSYGEELTNYTKIPYKIINNKDGIAIFIKNEIKEFNNFTRNDWMIE